MDSKIKELFNQEKYVNYLPLQLLIILSTNMMYNNSVRYLNGGILCEETEETIAQDI